MGKLIDGVWHDGKVNPNESDGKFKRDETSFRSWVTADGSPGPAGEGGFKAEAGRYHLYVSLACPWAHRTLIFRKLKGLEDAISVSGVHYFMGENGWEFHDKEGGTIDHLFGYDYLREVYTRADPKFTGRVTVPVLWDKERGTIVSNESAEIIRMLNSAFDDVGAKGPDFYPDALRDEINSVNDRVYDTVNNGVYKSGFATSQDAYEEACTALFDSLDWLEDILSRQRYIAGNKLTEADWRLFTTLVRFDPVYFGHFKCNVRRIVDYPNLWDYTRELYQVPGVAETVNIDFIKNHYYASHESVNPTRIVPIGPDIDYSIPHTRDRLAAAA